MELRPKTDICISRGKIQCTADKLQRGEKHSVPPRLCVSKKIKSEGVRQSRGVRNEYFERSRLQAVTRLKRQV